MVELWLPYGNTEVAVRIPDENLMGIIDKEDEPSVDPVSEIDIALENPLDCPKLNELVQPGKTVAIVLDDEMKRLPNSSILSGLFKRLIEAGVQIKDITIIMNCGTLSMTEEQARAMLGEENERGFKVQIHDYSAQDLKYVGKTRYGTRININRVFMDADVKILAGEIGFHYAAGYSGGRKSVLPAIVGIDSLIDHNALLLNSHARTGNLEGNPVHMNMEEALRFVDIDFAINVVLNSQNEVVTAFSGDVKQVFYKGVKLLNETRKVHVESKADIVIVSPGGAPFDCDLYRAYQGLDSALNIVKDKGVIVFLAECIRGYGEKGFYNWMTKFNSLSSIKRELKRNYVLGGHMAYYLRKALGKVKIILVSTMPDHYATGVFKFQTAKTANSAFRSALRMVGRNSKVLVLPHGSTFLPLLE